ncbi:MAG: metalloregulator ArsR/SmtB family transcription factor [Rhodothermales bacterium]
MSSTDRKLFPDALTDRIAQRLRVLGEPARLHLLNTLAENGEMNVQELVEATGIHQANASKHLNLMAREGLLSRSKSGLFVYYAIRDASLQGICLLLSGQIREELEQEQRTLRLLK